jgi:microcystin-dependent protein
MADPFLGQLLLASWGFAAQGYAWCNGQLLQISQNQALFSLLGTTFGGDGRVTYALPNLQGRTPVGYASVTGGGFALGQVGGEDSHTLVQAEVPLHTHQLQGTTSSADSANAAGNLPAVTAGALKLYIGGGSGLPAMNAATISAVGGSQPHENRQPFLALNWLIALVGIYPSRN